MTMKQHLKKLAVLLLAVALILSLAGMAEELPVSEEALDFGDVPVYEEIPEEIPEELDIADLLILDDSAQETFADESESALAQEAKGEAVSNAIPSKVTIGVKEKYTIDTSSLSGKLTFKSSKTSVATVSSKGVVTGKKAGTAKITVTPKSGSKKTITVTVAKAPTKVTLNKTKATVTVGKTLQLKATLPSKTASNQLTWTSSKKSVATVNANGKVTAKKAGTATITVKTFNGKKATCKVTVESKTVKPTSIALNKSDVLLLAGTGFYLKATVYPANAETKLTWSSSNTGDISVDQDGYVRAVSYGKAVITVTTDNGLSADCIVESTDMEVGLYIDEPISKVIDEMPIRLYEDDDWYSSQSKDVSFHVDNSNIVDAVYITPSNPVGRFEILGIWSGMDGYDCEDILDEYDFTYVGKTSSGSYVYDYGSSYRIGIEYDDDDCVVTCMLLRLS